MKLNPPAPRASRYSAWFILFSIASAIGLMLPLNSFAAFGLTTSTDYYTVDTGAGLVFKVRRVEEAGANANTISIGDIRSLVYNGVEYQNTARGSQINSGFDNLGYSNNTATVTAEVVNVNYIKVTVTTANLVHYYIARNGYPHIYMATWFNVQPVTGGGLCRYIVRASQSLLPNGPRPSDNSGTTYTVESSDIFGMPDGQTRSKHYSGRRLVDWFCTGATGNGVGAFMMRENQEGGSGGPFFRCLINQGGGDQELYDIINYGENQTEAFRGNILNGPYALVFNNGQFPSAPPDYSWWETAGLNLTNFIPASARGAVTGTITGVPSAFQTVVGFANTSAQYWTVASNGVYTTPLMIPGTYNVTLYKQEYAVATISTTVNAGATNTLNLNSTENNPAFIFKLGDWDGTPAGFLNADKMTYMHPSDTRMASWATTDFTVENDATATQFPCIQARQINGTLTLRFNLTAAQAASAHTLRIGITTGYIGGRPKVTMNSWVSANPAAPSQPNSRTFTTGSYRGNNTLYTYSVPASAFVTGQNVLYIYPISGSSDLGGWLSAGYVFDCVQLDGAPIAPQPPTNVAASPNASKVSLAWTPVFNAVGYKIKRATTHGGPYTTIATNVVASFNDTNIAAATRYFYVISAMNSVGESANSAEVVAGAAPTLVAYLPFDENAGPNATDATGNGWNGTLLNNASWSTGKYSSAANFNGTSNYVSLPGGVLNGLDNFTIATWVNLNSASVWSRIFDFGNNTTSYMFLTPQASGGGLRFAITVASGGGEQQINGTSPLPTGVWKHVAVTLNGSVGTLFVDGLPVGTNNAMTLKPSDLSQPAGSNPTLQNYLGKSQWADPYLNGRVDDFRIYNGALSAAQISALVSSPSLAPTNLVGTAITANQINLNWNAAAGATDYTVLRSTNSGSTYATLASFVTSTNFSDTGVFPGNTYYYRVAAVDNIGAEFISTPVAVTTPTGPDAPTNLVAIAVAPGQINLSWNASVGATNYLVKRANASGGPYTSIGTNITTTFADTGVTGGITYYYVVAASGPTGQGLNSTEASATALAVLQAHLKFDELSGTSAADATGHGWTGTLINGATHVSGYSSNAVGLASASSQYVTLPAGVMSNLNDFTIAAWVKQTSVSAWSRLFDFGTGTSIYMFLSPSNGLTGTLRFAITTSGNGNEQQINGTAALPPGVWKHVAVTLDGSVGILYVDGIAVGTNSAMTLTPASLGNTTLNYIGKSQFSDPYLNGLVDDFRIYGGALSASEVSSLATPLAAPTGLAAVAGDGQVGLNWNASVNATSYNVLRSLISGGPYTVIASNLVNLAFTDTAVSNGTFYYYVVSAKNNLGASPDTAPVGARPASTAPAQLGATMSGGQLQLSWPQDHTGWWLQTQTNLVGVGLSSKWFTVPGSAQTNQFSVPFDPSSGSVFFRLQSPY